MGECMDSLGEVTIFTTLEVNWDYKQIPVAPEDHDKTTFVCRNGVYHFKRMPSGLINAPASFERAIDTIPSQQKWKTCLVYLHDIIVFSNTVKEHFLHVKQILRKIQKASVILKIRKCK